MSQARRPRDLRLRWRTEVLSERGPAAAEQRLVAAAIAEHMQSDGTGAFPSERTLQAMTALNRRKVHAALESLIADGWLIARGRVGRGRYGVLSRELIARLPDGSNGAETVPMKHAANGAEGAPLGRAINGASMVQDKGFNGADQHFNGARIAPDLEEPEEPAGESARAFEVATLTEQRKQTALNLAPDCDPEIEWEKFKDWHKAKGKTPDDPEAAWRSWLYKCPIFNPRNAGKSIATAESRADLERQQLLNLGSVLGMNREPGEPDDAYAERVQQRNARRLAALQ